MFRQLVAEWREQAKRYQGNRRHVFTLCAEQLEETILAAELEKQENRKSAPPAFSKIGQYDSSRSGLSQSDSSPSELPLSERGSLDAAADAPEVSGTERKLNLAVPKPQVNFQDACVVVLKPSQNKKE